jgi:predicted RecB family nuclease
MSMHSEPIKPNETYNIKQVADFMGFSPRQIREKYINTEKLRTVRTGRKTAAKYFFPGSWLIEDLMHLDMWEDDE